LRPLELEKKNYIDKAVVEKQAEERGTHTGFLWYCRLHSGFDGGKELWTWFRVIISRELSIDDAPRKEEKESQGTDQYGYERRRGSSHWYKSRN
jgi:hypothetical protein